MRFYTNQHPFSCGLALHARSLSVGIVRQDGEILLHRHRPAAPAPFLKAIGPSRDGLVVAVAGLFTWYWLADLCATAGIPFVLGHALSLQAIHGGTANNDTIDSHKMAGLLRGGRLPHAYVYPAQMRATRDLWRRRPPLLRQRAALLAHVQHTHRQDNLPAMGHTIASNTNRAGVAARFAAPAVQKTLAVDLALLTADDTLLTDLERALGHTAKQPDAHTF
jgi:hypothetical protein